jgi:hypothetical protein
VFNIITATRPTISEHSRADLLSSLHAETDRHVVHFYRDAAFLAQNISDIAGRTLTRDGATVLIATSAHLGLIEEHLVRRGFDLEWLRVVGHYVALDAQEMLARLTVDGWPEEDRFTEVVREVIDHAIRNSPNGYVFAFGELVAILSAQDRTDRAVRLEQLWNALLKEYRFSLCCAYPLRDFVSEAALKAVFQICAEHSLTIPAENAL